MRFAAVVRCVAWGLVGLFLGAGGVRAAAPPSREGASALLAARAQSVLKANCYRCHGQEGAVEGGMNYVLDRDKLLARKKVLPGNPGRSPLYLRVARGKMPPPGETPRPSPADLALLRDWIKAGAPAGPVAARPVLAESAVLDHVLADLDRLDRRARRFTRYLSLVSLANAGHGPDELTTYTKAVGKLLNSLSWNPRITLPKPVGPGGLLLRIDLRDYQWDANTWNRLLAEYPYGVLHDSAVARAVLNATATRMPVVRADWFVASASRPPLYYDILQTPSNLGDLERQLRVDVAADLRQERVARAGFNGSGISRNNRLIERHDALTGAYWRTYDFEAVPQNLSERDTLLPDRRNLFAYPLGPGSGENNFRHAGGEVIFNLPNGLQGYVLVNASDQRIDKGPTAIVSDPKRPDRAVEVGVSCINCHARGIHPKDDQVRAHVRKNTKHFSRADRETVLALYPRVHTMRKLMDADAERFRKAVEKTGNKVSAAEVVMAMTLRYEADVDLPTLAAEVGLRPKDLLPHLTASENLAKNLGALKLPGATVSRQVVVQSFGDLVRELRLGGVSQPGVTGESLPDATGEADPLEAQSSPANAASFSPDRKLAAFAANDRSVRIWDVEAGRDLRRCVGHTASVWCVAFSPDGTKLLSGGKDGTVRLWDVETGRELRTLEGHSDLVTAVAFGSEGRRALSAGYDGQVLLWDLETGKRVEGFSFGGAGKYVNDVAFSPGGGQALVCAGRVVYLVDPRTGKVLRRLEGHSAWVVRAVFSADGKRVLTAGDDGTARLWDAGTGRVVQVFRGHQGYVKAVELSPDGAYALTGGSDATVRLWEVASGKELRAFRNHAEPLAAVAFADRGRATLSVSRDASVRLWRIAKLVATPTPPARRAYPPAGEGAREVVRPVGVVPVGGTVGGLLLSPDSKALYYLDLTGGTLGRVDTRTLRRDRLLRLADGTDAVALTPDGKSLVATALVKGGRSASTRVQVVNSAKLQVRKAFTVDAAGYDVAAGDGVGFLSGGAGDWTDVTVVDVEKGSVLASWGGVWAKSFLRLSPDGKRLYCSSQGVVPGTLDALVIPAKWDERPATYRAPGHDRQALGGEFVISPDGKYLLCKTGAVLRLSAEKDSDLRPYAKLPPFLAAAVDVEGGSAYVLGRDGELRRYAYPEFRLRGTYRLSLAGYALAVDGKAGRLYVAGFDPAAVAERPRARSHGDIHVYDLRELGGGSVRRWRHP